MPLTTTGICLQILGSISTLRREINRCSQNDCKVVLNLLTRKFSEPLKKQGRQRVYITKAAKGYSGKAFIDHAIPVGEIMKQLLSLPDVALSPTEENVSALDAMLTDMLLLVRVTDAEEAALNAAGLQRKMPREWSDPTHKLYRDPWARYKAIGLTQFTLDG